MILTTSCKVPIMVKFTKEEWKQIPEYPDYWVSNLGRTNSYRGEQGLLQWYAKWCKSHPYKEVN